MKLSFQRLKHRWFYYTFYMESSCVSRASTNEKSRSWGAAGKVSPLGEAGPRVQCNRYNKHSLYLVPSKWELLCPSPSSTTPTPGGSAATPLGQKGQTSHFKAPPLAKHLLVPSEIELWHRRYSCRWDGSNFPYSPCPAVKKLFSSLLQMIRFTADTKKNTNGHILALRGQF